MPPKYPNVRVKLKLTGKDGNAFAILDVCKNAAHKARIDGDEIVRFLDEATAGDYHHLLATCKKWFNVTN